MTSSPKSQKRSRLAPRRNKVLVIVGPTSSGKSDLAIQLAKKYNGEIVSADSRQVYRGMDIGTGKVTPREQKMAPHHLLDVTSPKRDFSAARYVKMARKAIVDIQRRGKLPIVVGGTGFYIDALLGRITLPDVPPNKKLRRRLEKLGVEHLFKMLQKLDPRRANSIDRHNKRRLIRALEIILTTKKQVPVPDSRFKNQDSRTMWFGLNPDRKTLAKRIEKRLDARLKQGMVREVQKLHRNGVSWKRLENFGLEYRWVARYLQGKITKKEMREGLLRDIIRYSKRQMTWFTRPNFAERNLGGFKRNKGIRWFTGASGAFSELKTFLSHPMSQNSSYDEF